MEGKTKRLTIIIVSVMALIFLLVLIFGLSGKREENNSAENKTETTTEANVQDILSTGEAEVLEPAEKDTLTLSFIGDCIIGSESGKINDGNFSYMAANSPHTYFFEKVVSELSKDDFTIANMECVITDRDLEKIGKDYDPAFWYKTPTSNTDILTLGSVEVASIVNNHIGDYGDEGYDDTVVALKSHGLQVGENLKPLYIEKNGIKIGLLCCNLWSSYNVSYIEEALETMQNECEYKIVFFHGGEEGIHEPDNYKIDACRYLANSGLCDLIVGSHPHVLQPMEVVNDVPILYSLGNFCYSAANYPDNQTVIFRVELKKEENKVKAETELVPCYVYTGYMNNYQPMIMPEGEDKDRTLALMNSKVEYRVETTASTAEPTTVAQPTEVPSATLPQEDDYAEDDFYTDEEVFQGVQVPY
ncbi:MAG: CapA family protein [Ruminococcaceae bacterium]|nr:CapA family protein [Oscillospiraceae bacterium]